MSNELLIAVIGVLWLITTALVSILFSVYSGKMKANESNINDHEKRIQRVEDIYGTSVKESKQEIKELKSELQEVDKKIVGVANQITNFETELKNLANNIHKEKGQEAVLNTTLEGLHKTLLIFQDKLLEK